MYGFFLFWGILFPLFWFFFLKSKLFCNDVKKKNSVTSSSPSSVNLNLDCLLSFFDSWNTNVSFSLWLTVVIFYFIICKHTIFTHKEHWKIETNTANNNRTTFHSLYNQCPCPSQFLGPCLRCSNSWRDSTRVNKFRYQIFVDSFLELRYCVACENLVLIETNYT